jgi:hypothetical protein
VQQTWLEPWGSLKETERPLFEIELRKELRPDHILFDVATSAFGKSDANDDVLFKLLNSKSGYALVHLTWLGRQEKSGDWPFTQLFATWDDFVTQRMQEDHFNY